MEFEYSARARANLRAKFESGRATEKMRQVKLNAYANMIGEAAAA